MAQPATIGRLVRYVMPSGKARPAIVVEVWPDEKVNLQVFTDGQNDDMVEPGGLIWRTSVVYDGGAEPEPGTWHWPPRG